MPYDPNDQRLTAYVLGELDQADRQAVEALLADDQDCRVFVDELRSAADLLTQEFEKERNLVNGLGTEFRETIEERLKPAVAGRVGFRRWREVLVAAGILGIAIALTLPAVQAKRSARRSVALMDRPNADNLARFTTGPRQVMVEHVDNDAPAVAQSEAAGAPPSRLEIPGVYQALNDKLARNSPGAPAAGRGVAPSRIAGGMPGMMGGMAGKDQYAARAPIAAAESSPTALPEARAYRFSTPAATPPVSSAAPNEIATRLSKVELRELSRPDLARPQSAKRLEDLSAALPPADREVKKEAEVNFESKPKALEELVERKRLLESRDGTDPAAREKKLDEAIATERDDAAAVVPPAPPVSKPNSESYAQIHDNRFLDTTLDQNRLSTFSIDVDTGAYANVRRFLTQNMKPPAEAVRIEELLNYFPYDYPAPKGDVPFSVNVEVAGCPWNSEHRLARIALKGKTIDHDKRPTSNLVFLVDVSGSMQPPNKLPMLKAGLKLLVDQLSENDRVAIVTYAAGTRVALPSTACDRKRDILDALDRLEAGGGTNGGAGIELAYQQAVANFIKGGTNRVILATDGDFNVGLSKAELLAKSEEKAKTGVFLSVLGFGEGNLQEDFMEQLADKGNGNYSYIDTIQEARKVLVQEMSGTLVTIAKDVKIQVEFNPAKITSYRLIGYENRMLRAEDFRDDKKDAGEIGAGHTVTALYEIVPVGAKSDVKKADVRTFKYQNNKTPAPAAANSPESFSVALRYKLPDADKASEFDLGVTDQGRSFADASGDFKFAASVASFGMLLRDSPFKGSATWSAVEEIAGGNVGEDRSGYRKEFTDLVRKARELDASGN